MGLGTGSTAYHMVNAVGEMVKNGLKIQAIPTSKATEAQARELGIPLLTIDELDHVDLAIDGVDEIDPQFNAIKGGGGALYREKVVASMAKEVIWIMDESKLVDKIGAFHLPVEIAQYGSKQAMERMAAYGWNPVLRVRDGKTFVTDNGNFIADLHLGAGFDIQDVYSKLTGMLGVLEHGLFLNMCKRMIVGHSNGEVQVIEKDIIRQTPVLIAVTYIKGRCGFERDGSYTTEKKDRWQMFDAGVACQTFCLAAHEYGLGTVIMGVFDESGISSLLDIPKERELAALIALGYPDIEPSAPKRKTVEDLLQYR